MSTHQLHASLGATSKAALVKVGDICEHGSQSETVRESIRLAKRAADAFQGDAFVDGARAISLMERVRLAELSGSVVMLLSPAEAAKVRGVRLEVA